MDDAAQTDASAAIEMGLMVGGTDVTGHEKRHSLVPLIDGFASSGMRLGRSEKAAGTGSAGNAPAALVKAFALQASSGLPHVAVSHYSATARRPWRQSPSSLLGSRRRRTATAGMSTIPPHAIILPHAIMEASGASALLGPVGAGLITLPATRPGKVFL